MVDSDDEEPGVDGAHFHAEDIERVGRFGGPVTGVALTQMLLAVGGFPAFAALAGAVASPLISGAAKTIADRHNEKLQLAADTACSEGQCTFDYIVSSTVDNDTKIELLRQALDGAAVADDLRRVKALGRALAKGALQEDAAKVFAEVRIVEALRVMDGADGRLLAHMIESEQLLFRVGQPGDSPGTLHGDLPELSPVMDALVARLSTHGLITTQTVGGGGRVLDPPPSIMWKVTDFGQLCMMRWQSESIDGLD